MNRFYQDILSIIEEDARMPAAKIAVMLGKSEAEVSAAVADMEKRGVILKYTAILNEDKLEKDSVQALIEVKVSPVFSKGFDEIAEDILQFDEVRSLYLMSGAYDLAVFIEGRTLKEVASFVSEKLSVMDKVLSTATHFILKKYKSEGVVTGAGGDAQRLVVYP